MWSPFLGLFGQDQKAHASECRLQGVDLHMSGRVDCVNHMYHHAEIRLEESHPYNGLAVALLGERFQSALPQRD